MSTFINLAEVIYPVGSIYESTSSVSPATIFGGTWSAISGRMLIGANSTYAIKSTGGEATHTLTDNEMPEHNHGMRLKYADNSGSNAGHTSYWGNYRSSTFQTDMAGGGSAQQSPTILWSLYMGKNSLALIPEKVM